ncbi:MAG: hypothetical protein Q8L48_30260 [Archangium sp.]|nr:hypothetical protein [Archangium sp.]
MEIQPVNLTELAAVIMSCLIVLIPVMGVTARFAVKPLIDALVQSGVLGALKQGAPEAELGRLSRRVLELEQVVARLEGPPVTDERSLEPQPVELRRLRT